MKVKSQLKKLEWKYNSKLLPSNESSDKSLTWEETLEQDIFPTCFKNVLLKILFINILMLVKKSLTICSKTLGLLIIFYLIFNLTIWQMQDVLQKLKSKPLYCASNVSIIYSEL